MKKVLLLFLSVFLVLAPVNAQVLRTNPLYTNNSTTPPSGYCAEYQTVYDAMTTPPSSIHAEAQNTFVESAKTHGYWTIFVVFWFYAQDYNTDGEELLNWKDPATHACTLSATAPTWTALEGYLGNGSGANNATINTNWNPVADYAAHGSIDFIQDAASYGGYTRVEVTESKYVGGGYDGSNRTRATVTSTGVYASCNAGGETSRSEGATSLGHIAVVRSAAAVTKFYRNGDQVSTTATTASTGVPNVNFYVLHYSNAASSNNQVSMFFAGGVMTDQQVLDFSTDFEVLMDALGTGVQ